MNLLCIETHPDKLVFSGECYHLLSDKCPCNCKAVDVGSRNSTVEIITICPECGVAYKTDNVNWIGRNRFVEIAEETRAYRQVETANL